MSELRTSILIDLAGNLERKAQTYSRSLNRFSGKGRQSLGRLNSAAAATGKAFDRLGNRYVALATGAAGVGSAKMLVELERRFTRLGIQANASNEDMERLKSLIYDTASAPDIRIDPSQLTSAIEKIVEKTGDLEFAKNNIRNIGLAIQAAGAHGADIGAIVSEFKKLGITTEQDVLIALDTLVSQGKAGAFTLQNLATQGERAVSSFTAMGYEGQGAVQAMGALLQVSRMGTSGPEAAATAYENMLKTIIEKSNELQAAGISVFDSEKLKEGVEAFKPMPGILKEIIQKSGGRATLLSKLFGAEGFRAITNSAAEFQKKGNFSTLDKFIKIQGDGSQITSDSARAANDAAAALQNLYTTWKKFADESLTKPIQNLSNALNHISSETTGDILQSAVIGGAGLFAAGKAYKYGSRLFNRKGKKGGAGNLAAGGVQQVYVVNMPGAAGFGAGATAAGTGKDGKKTPKKSVSSRLGVRTKVKPSRFGKIAKYGSKFLSKAALPLTALASTAALYSTLTNDQITRNEKIADSIGIAGGVGTAALGAAIGTALLPGVGTVIGAVVAGVGGDAAISSIADYFLSDDKKTSIAEQKNYTSDQPLMLQQQNAQLNISVSDDRVKVSGLEAVGMDIDVSGMSMVGS